ncbi:hypothetical protein DD829_22340 [Chryseobacterium sp. HMWF035]|nr:hypothetical protein DD829_22340 [Chryseobacterium sp. HMWF035]
MSVKVEVADREKVKEAAIKEFNPDLKNTINNIDGFINNKDKLINDIGNFYLQKNGITLSNETINNYRMKVENVFNAKYNETYKEIADLNDKLKSEYQRKELLSSSYTVEEIRDKIELIKKDLANYHPVEGSNLSELIKTEIKKTMFYKMINETEESITSKSKRLRFHLLGDPMTSFIAKDSNINIWESTFNKTYSRNIFGNSDIAVILKTNPPDEETKSGDYNNNFTIKGVRLDSDDAINATFNVMSQAINMISTIYGAPKFASNNNATDPTPEQIEVINNLPDTSNDYNINEKKLKNFKKLLITFIENEEIDSKSKTGDDLKNSIERINEYWTAIKTEINK